MKKITCLALTLSMIISLIFASGALAFLKGDMNGDDQIDNKDVVSLFRFVSASENVDYDSAFDINEDGFIDNKDVVSLFRSLSTSEEKYEPTPDNCFDFEKKPDGTYELKPDSTANLPETLIIPETYNGKSVTSIGEGAFKNCTVIVIVIILGNIRDIGDHAFDGCTNLKNVKMSDDLQTVGDYAFNGCSSLTSVTFGKSVTSIGEGAFSGCTNLVRANMPNSVTDIGAQAFYRCSSLSGVSFGTNLRSIGEKAFSYCIVIIIIIIPENVENIGKEAFAYCSGLKTVRFGGSLTSIGAGAFSHCDSLESVDIPDSVTEIGANAFADCVSLTTVTIGSNVVRIGDGAFSGCILIVIIIIPENVGSLGKNIFADCTALAKVIFNTVNGWYANGTKISPDELSDPEKAAELLKADYSEYEWTTETSSEEYGSNIWVAHGQYLLANGTQNAWDGKDTSLYKASTLKSIKLNLVKGINESLYEALSGKDILYLYTIDLIFGTKDSGWESKFYKDGSLYNANGSYCFKIAKCNIKTEGQIVEYVEKQWVPDPVTSNAESLTPETLFIPPWQNEKDENGFNWNNNPVVTGGAGLYTLVIVQYKNSSSAGHPGFGIGLVLKEKMNGIDYEEIKQFIPSEHTYGVIGSFSGSDWSNDVAMTAAGNNQWKCEIELTKGTSLKVRADGSWIYSWGDADGNYISVDSNGIYIITITFNEKSEGIVSIRKK